MAKVWAAASGTERKIGAFYTDGKKTKEKVENESEKTCNHFTLIELLVVIAIIAI